MAQPLTFKYAYRRTGPVFSALMLCMYAYTWGRYPSLVPFLDHAFLYQLPLIIVHAWFALALSWGPAESIAYEDEEFEIDGFENPPELIINPGSGLPMVGGFGGVDVAGNAFGTHSDD